MSEMPSSDLRASFFMLDLLLRADRVSAMATVGSGGSLRIRLFELPHGGEGFLAVEDQGREDL
jgi:hypothetical protein